MRMVSVVILSLSLLAKSALACEGDHWIREKSTDGSIVILEDNSVWRIELVDRVHSLIWLPTQKIVSCEESSLLINVDQGEKVGALKIA